jgi:hypothetical protein
MEDKSKEITTLSNTPTLLSKDQTNEITITSKPLIEPIIETPEDKVYILNSKEVNSIGFEQNFRNIDKIEGSMEISIDGGKGSLIISKNNNFNKDPLKIFDSCTAKLFRFIIYKLTEQHTRQKKEQENIEVIKITVSEYQKITNRNDPKNVKKQMEKDLEILFNCRIKFSNVKIYKDKVRTRSSLDVRIMPAKANLEWGKFTMALMPKLVSHLIDKDQLLEIHKYYWKASDNAADLLYKLSTLKRINLTNKKSKNKKIQIIKTTKLIKDIKGIPTYESIRKPNDGHVRRKIIDPLKKL